MHTSHVLTSRTIIQMTKKLNDKLITNANILIENILPFLLVVELRFFHCRFIISAFS